MPKFNIGDKVYVTNWGKQYHDFYRWENNEKKLIWGWQTEIPDYSEPTYHWKHEYKPKLTLKGVPFKNGEKELVSKTPVYKDYKYEILEIVCNGEDTICLIASLHTETYCLRCFAQVEMEGLSLLTPEQFANKEFNALKEFHKGRHSPATKDSPGDYHKVLSDTFPKSLIKQIFDKDDNVLFGNHYVKGKVHYDYIPAEFMSTGKPYILSVGIDYDGKGNSDLPKDAILMEYNELPKMFPDNVFR